MKQRLSTIALVAAVLALCVAAYATWQTSQIQAQIADVHHEDAVQYVLYVGTNDKDTDKPKYTQEEARDLVDDVCLEHFDSYTLMEATGAWLSDEGDKVHEYSLVCYIDGEESDADEVHALARDLNTKLNQSAILIESSKIAMDYYTER